eukprot:2183788-Rhodomonas_salina.2
MLGYTTPLRILLCTSYEISGTKLGYDAIRTVFHYEISSTDLGYAATRTAGSKTVLEGNHATLQGIPTVLLAPYSKSGTEKGHLPTTKRRGTEIGYDATKNPVLRSGMLLPGGAVELVGSLATMQVQSAICLRFKIKSDTSAALFVWGCPCLPTKVLRDARYCDRKRAVLRYRTVMFRNKPPTRVVQNTTKKRGGRGLVCVGTSRQRMRGTEVAYGATRSTRHTT